jgi:hypothetical protein
MTTVASQNTLIQNTIDSMDAKNSADGRVSYYVDIDNQSISYQNRILIIIYSIFAIVLGVLIILNKKLSRYFKLGIIVLIIVYPFFIIGVEQFIYTILMFFFSLLFGKSFTNSNWQYTTR